MLAGFLEQLTSQLVPVYRRTPEVACGDRFWRRSRHGCRAGVAAARSLGPQTLGCLLRSASPPSRLGAGGFVREIRLRPVNRTSIVDRGGVSATNLLISAFSSWIFAGSSSIAPSFVPAAPAVWPDLAVPGLLEVPRGEARRSRRSRKADRRGLPRARPRRGHSCQPRTRRGTQ